MVASLLALASQASTIPPPSGQCFDTTTTSGFNGIFFGDYRGSSDIEGKIAIEGNGVFADGFSVADKVSDVRNCNGYTAVIKGSLQWKSGRNYYGNIAVGQTSQVAAGVLDQGCRVVTNANAFDFTAAKQTIVSLSQKLSQMPITVKSKSIDASLKLSITFSGVADIEVMQLDPNDFGGLVKELADPVGVKSGATIVFNIKGSAAGLSNMNMEVLAKYNVIFNFYEATSVRIGGIAVRGSVIAPNANIADATGVIWGAVYAKSMTGPCQINLKPLNCVRQAPPAPIQCRLRPAVLYTTTTAAAKTTVVVPVSTYVPKVQTSAYVSTVLPTTQPAPTSTPCSTTTTTTCSTTTTTCTASVTSSVQAIYDLPTTTTPCSSATVLVRAYRPSVIDGNVSAATQSTETATAVQTYQTASAAANVSAVTDAPLSSSTFAQMVYQTGVPSGSVSAATQSATTMPAYQTAGGQVSAQTQQPVSTLNVFPTATVVAITAPAIYQTATVAAVSQAVPTCTKGEPLY